MDGDYTYIGARGCTVIEYIVRNGKEEGLKEKLEVKEMIGSDHLTIIYRWGIKKQDIEEDGIVKELISWKECYIMEYKRKIIGIGKKIEWKEIKEHILRSLQRKKWKYRLSG